MSDELTMGVDIAQQTVLPDESGAIALTADDIIELEGDFNYDGFQVVRREFFAHTFEPSITLNNYKVYVNAACLNRFPEIEHVQLLINSETNIMALRPCAETDRDSFAWCSKGTGRRKPKQVTCRLFFAKLFTMMNWNPDYRYKLLGKIVCANGMYLIVFDLSATEVYQRTFVEGQKPKNSRVPVFPAAWQNQFGMPFEEHRKSLQINTFNGYAVYEIKEKQAPKPDGDSAQVQQLSLDNSTGEGVES